MTPIHRLPWWRGWLPLLVLPMAVLAAPIEWPRWVGMWVLALALFVGCKWLTWRRTPVRAPRWKQWAYWFAWPGMDAVAFFQGVARRPTTNEWLFAMTKITLGLVLLCGVVPRLPPALPYLVGWVGMVGLMFVLHFGLFHLLACWWQARGIDAKPLMVWPLLATSCSDFWGRRWNTAFRDLTHRFLFRPCVRRWGPCAALVLGFVGSGLVHDLVISVPAGGGYGGPTVFFLVQGGAVVVERSAFGRRLGLGQGWRGWLFTASALLVPVYWLFHPPFVEGVIVPFLRFLGACP